VATFIHADVDIKVQAEGENKHEAEVIRELLSKGMKKSTGKAQESTGDSLPRLAAISGKGPADYPSYRCFCRNTQLNVLGKRYALIPVREENLCP
jgi:hypothetical protein